MEASEAFASHYELLVAKALFSSKMGTVPLRIINVLDQPCFLPKSTVAAVYEPVDAEKVETIGSLEGQESETVMSPEQQRSTVFTSLDQETSKKPPYLIALLSQKGLNQLAPLKPQNLSLLPPLVQ